FGLPGRPAYQHGRPSISRHDQYSRERAGFSAQHSITTTSAASAAALMLFPPAISAGMIATLLSSMAQRSWASLRHRLCPAADITSIIGGLVALDDARVAHERPAPGEVVGIALGLLAAGKTQRVAHPLAGHVGDHFGLEAHNSSFLIAAKTLRSAFSYHISVPAGRHALRARRHR